MVGDVVNGQESILLIAGNDSVTQAIQLLFDRAGYRTIVSRTAAALPSESWVRAPSLIVIDRPSTNPAPLSQHDALRDLPVIAIYQRVPDYDENASIRDHEHRDNGVRSHQHHRQLVAQVRAILRRPARQESVARQYTIGGLHVNLETHDVRVNGTSIELTRKEFLILRCLLEAAGRVVSRQVLWSRVWGQGQALKEHVVDVHIHNLRIKIEADPSRPQYLITVRGVGYKLRVGA